MRPAGVPLVTVVPHRRGYGVPDQVYVDDDGTIWARHFAPDQPSPPPWLAPFRELSLVKVLDDGASMWTDGGRVPAACVDRASPTD